MLRSAATEHTWLERQKAWALLLMAAAAMAVSVAAALVVAGPAQADGYIVTNTNDSGEGSLREAINQANANPGGDSILFNVGRSATITLSSKLPKITDGSGLAIDGGNASITISSDRKARVFEVDTTGKLALNKLTVDRGRSVESSGGAIRNEGTLEIDNSTISNSVNTVRNPLEGTCGGGLFNARSGTAKVSNSTFSGNVDVSRYGTGGGICNDGDLTVTSSTISDNSSGGLHARSGHVTKLKNTILANNPSGGRAVGREVNCFLPPDQRLIDGGYNIDSGDKCNFSTANNSLSKTDPKLGPLADNGGLTKTHALLPGTPALDAGNNDFAVNTKGFRLPYDQRGPGFRRIVGETVDIGSFEVQAPRTTPPPRAPSSE